MYRAHIDPNVAARHPAADVSAPDVSSRDARASGVSGVGVSAVTGAAAVRSRPIVRLAAAVVPPWLAARVLVAAALAVMAVHGLSQTGDVRPASGVLVWDGGWYAGIARHGYGAYDVAALRFFPLLPLLGRAAGYLTGGSVTAGLLLVANLAAAVYLVLIVVLTRLETGDDGTARRAAWIAALAPGAAVLALPYTESTAGALAVGMFLCLRTGRTAGAGVLGFLSGLARPTGVLLTVPALLALIGDRPRGVRQWAARVPAAVSPLLGAGCYLAWCRLVFGDALLPYSVQTRPDLRGGWVVNPLRALFHNTPGGLDWRLTLVLLAVAAALLVVVARRLPLPYAAWSAVMLAAAMTSTQEHSLPRYVANVFPLVMAAAMVIRPGRAYGCALALCAIGFTVLALIGFTPGYVP